MSLYFRLRGKDNRLLLAILGGLTCLFPMGIDLYLPAMPAIASDMGESLDRIQLSLSVYTFSFSLGLLFFGPFSDKNGRMPSLVIGVCGYAFTYLLTIWTKNAEQLIAVRIAQGITGAAIMASIPSMVHDIFRDKKQCARAMSFILMVTMVAPMVAPFIGGYLLKWWNWQSLFFFLSGCGIIAILLTLFLSETHPEQKRSKLTSREFAKRYVSILRHKKALGCMLVNSLFLGGLFAFITSSPFVYINLYGIAPENYGFLFALNIIAISVGNIINMRLMNKLSLVSLIKKGSLITTVAGIALFISALADTVPLAFVVIPVVLFVSCMGLIGPNSNALIMSYFPDISGSANALAGVLRFGIAGIASAMVSFLHDGTILPMALVMALCGVGSLLASRLIDEQREGGLIELAKTAKEKKYTASSTLITDKDIAA